MPRAAGLADEIKKQFNVSATLLEGSGGVFDVHVDGKSVWSKHEVGRFPENHEVIANIRQLQQGPC